jgi:RNA polymerase sigma-70 factor (ECF subfamily)
LLEYLEFCGYRHEQAEDLVQGFFLDLIRSNAIARADPSKGRLRNFLLSILKHYLAKERRQRACLKRGGEVNLISIEDLPRRELDAGSTCLPAIACQCDRAWASDVSERATDRLRIHYIYAGEGRLFDCLHPYVYCDRPVPYRRLQRRLVRRVPTLRSDVSRLRDRYLTLLREELASTVAPEELAEEWRYLTELLFRA